MKRLLIAAALFACWSSTAAAKTACLPSHGTDAYYQYRIIDGKRCWYAGHERLEKSALAWKEVHRVVHRPSDKAQPAVAIATAEPPQAQPDFDAVFAHFPAYEVAHPPIHLLFPKNVAQAWGSKRVAVVVYRRPE